MVQVRSDAGGAKSHDSAHEKTALDSVNILDGVATRQTSVLGGKEKGMMLSLA